MRIEGYDISNLGPEHVVASMVVFEGGVPRKSDYRKFSIAGVDGQDDFASMKEALTRRFTGPAAPWPTRPSTIRPSSRCPTWWWWTGAKASSGWRRGCWKRPDWTRWWPCSHSPNGRRRSIVPGRADPVWLERDDPALLLLQRVRDEAHRFALTFHRARRRSRVTTSILDELPGVGEKRKQAILRHFGSPDRFLQASREDLEAVPGLPGKVARDIYDYVHKTG